MACWSIVHDGISFDERSKRGGDMNLIIDNAGMIRCLYGEEIDLSSLGGMTIVRGSHVEPNEDGKWLVDLSPVNGPMLGPFNRRSQALAAESRWLEVNRLMPRFGL